MGDDAPSLEVALLRSALIASCLVAIACGPDRSPSDLDSAASRLKPVGQPCEASTDGQGNCQPGHVCERMAEGQFRCTKTCRVDADCGTNSGFQNVCDFGGCRFGCDPATKDSCPKDWACYNYAPLPYCMPDCRTIPNYCGTTRWCDRLEGTCERQGDRKHYESCGAREFCGPETKCVTRHEAQASLCMQQCLVGESCPGSDRCAVAVSDGSTFCARPCSPQVPTCPLGMGCWALNEADTFYCMP